jgi:hypothetical protein
VRSLGLGYMAIEMALIQKFGLVLGHPNLALSVVLPTGLERLKQVSPELVPWAWGLNGMACVVAPILAVAVSMTAGITALFLAAVPVYLLAGFSEISSARRP